MSAPCFSDKASARKHFSKLRRELSAECRQIYDNALVNNIVALPEFEQCGTLLLFHPTKNEPDLLKLVSLALSCGKQVAFPISNTDTLTLDFRMVNSLDELVLGNYGIAEPRQDAPDARIDDQTLCIVPALAYDIHGYRIGYGKGYYDRFLKAFRGVSLGAVYNGFLCNTLPIDSNDMAVDIIITQTGVIHLK